MKASLLILDPKGDVELILRQPNTNQQKSHQELDEEVDNACDKDSDQEEAVIKTVSPEGAQTDEPANQVPCDYSDSIHEPADLAALKPYDDRRQPIEVRFRVSSGHLSLASPFFRAIFEGSFSERTRNERGLYEIKAFEWSAGALLILLDIIHGHHRSVPRSVDLDVLEQIAVLVDYYQCHEIVELFAERWIAASDDALPKDYGQPCMSWLFIAWVFSDAKLFNSMASMSVRLSKGPLETSLPLPGAIFDKIESRRQALSDEVVDNVYGLLESLWATTDGCCIECSCMLLGSLMKQMR
ncbi:hypothetical protein ACJ41O_009119 [Fusarium nematophilum]